MCGAYVSVCEFGGLRSTSGDVLGLFFFLSSICLLRQSLSTELWWSELVWLPQTHVFECLATGSSTIRRCGLVGVGVAFVEAGFEVLYAQAMPSVVQNLLPEVFCKNVFKN